MILSYNNNKKRLFDLVEIVSDIKDDDFYITHNNERKKVDNSKTLEILLKESSNVFYKNTRYSKGMVLVWKSLGGEIQRNYIKIIADSKETASQLITYLLWNFNKELHVKIKKDSKFISVFKEYGFRFLGGRGTQILLSKKNKTTRV